MQSPLPLAAGAVLAGLLLIYAVPRDAGRSTTTTPPEPPAATGHYVLVVEGDCDQLGITHASHKVDPWAGASASSTTTAVITC